jgi:tetratricopeptide (TPR) repeat protein
LACDSTTDTRSSRGAVGTIKGYVVPSREVCGSPGRNRRLRRTPREDGDEPVGGRRFGRFCLAVALCGLLPGAGSLGDQAREALQRAAVLAQEGRLEEAERQAQPALSDPETRAAACSVLGTIRLQQNRLGESAQLLQEAIRLEPHLLGAHLNLAQLYTLQGKAELALPVFRRVLELDPSNAGARMALARSETEKGNYQQSLELARPALADFKESPEGLLILATDFLKTGDRSSAAGLVEASRRLAGVPPAWTVSFAQLLVENTFVSEGLDVLERARKVDPSSYELAFALGGAYLVKGDPVRALEAYDLALGLKPASVMALRQAAAVAERQGELERSLSYWMRAKKVAADDPMILLGFGRVCLKMDLLEDAEPALVRAAGLRPGEATYQYTLAVAKVGKRQYEAAQGLLEPLVEKRPDDAALQYALGSVLYMQGQLAEADARLRESLRLDPEQLASHYYLALVARDQGHDAEAIEMLEELLRLHPDHASSCEALGGLLMNGRRYAEAERLLRRAIELNPKSVKANYQLGLLLARTGRREEADKQLEMAKSLREEDDATSRLQLRLLDPGA